MPDVAIYGLGEMGAEIARCIINRGLVLSAHDPVVDPGIDSPGFVLGSSVRDTASAAPVHLVVVRLLADVESLLFSADGLGVYAPKDSLIVLHTTVSPQVARDLRQRVADQFGHTLIDAALSRRDGKISEGSLSMLVGGTEADLTAARPILNRYADNVVHVGLPGAGMTAKLCNNWLLYSNRHAMLQALTVGKALGLDIDVLRLALAACSGSSWALTHYSELDAAILEGHGAPTVVRERTSSELCMAREMTVAVGRMPTTLEETFTLLDAMQRLESTDAGWHL